MLSFSFNLRLRGWAGPAFGGFNGLRRSLYRRAYNIPLLFPNLKWDIATGRK
jgi:hypothetical protein